MSNKPRYTLNEPPAAVHLDSDSVSPDVVLLLDDFFRVVVWNGEQVQNWVTAGYHEQAEYAHLKAALTTAQEEAVAILQDRMPVPRYVQTAGLVPAWVPQPTSPERSKMGIKMWPRKSNKPGLVASYRTAQH